LPTDPLLSPGSPPQPGPRRGSRARCGALAACIGLQPPPSTLARPTAPPAASHARRWDSKYWTTYKVLDILQKVFYRSNPAREAYVELCEDTYVQKMTFDSYLYKTVVPGNPVDDFKLLVRTVRGGGSAHPCPLPNPLCCAWRVAARLNCLSAPGLLWAR
jgi:hypothetical protein